MENWKRKLAIVAKLSRYKKLTASDLKRQLGSEGVSVTLRTIQRDLEELEGTQQFAIQRDESKPIGWSYAKDVKVQVPNIDLTTSLSFALAEQHLAHLMPPVMRERLDPYVRGAKQFLAGETKASEGRWLKKVHVHAQGLPLLPADIAQETIEDVYNAVLKECCLTITYTSLREDAEKVLVIHPHGIVVRGERTYLIGVVEGYQDVRQFALCRVHKTECLTRRAEINPAFSLKRYVEQGQMGVKRQLATLAIKLWVTPVLAAILDETPLCDGQRIEPHDGDFIVHANLEDTDELRHWLLSMCNHATVLEPQALRDEIKGTLSNAVRYYE